MPSQQPNAEEHDIGGDFPTSLPLRLRHRRLSLHPPRRGVREPAGHPGGCADALDAHAHELLPGEPERGGPAGAGGVSAGGSARSLRQGTLAAWYRAL